MTDRPIIFSAPMVRALLNGQKTMTRRLAWRDAKFGLQDFASEQLEDMELRGWNVVGEGNEGLFRTYKPTAWQQVKAGDRLWVRENYAARYFDGGKDAYGADWSGSAADVVTRPKWTPCIHMPRTASRLTLIVTSVKTEPLDSISPEDALAEGCKVIRDNCYVFEGTGYDQAKLCHGSPVTAFSILWDELHGDDAWIANPEVVAISFRVVEANIDATPSLPASGGAE